MGVIWLKRTLAETAGRDESRPALMGIHHAKEGWLVGTDGQRLFAVKDTELPHPDAVVGATYASGPFVASQRLLRPQREADAFPAAWKGAVPKEAPKAIFRAELPEWIGAKKKRAMFIRAVVLVGGKSPHFRLGEQWPEDGLCAVDLRWLRPYAKAPSVFIGYHDRNTPLVFSDSAESVRTPWNAPWFGMVMPLRPERLEAIAVLEKVE